MELAPYQKVCDARDFRLLKSSIVLANLEIPTRMPWFASPRRYRSSLHEPPRKRMVREDTNHCVKVNIDREMPFIKNSQTAMHTCLLFEIY